MSARRAGALFLALVGLIALAADLIASDLPLYCRVAGHAYLLPCLTRPDALSDTDQQLLVARGATVVGTPIAYGPAAQRPGGVLDKLAPPSRAHWLGTDDRGRDVAARLVHVTRVACAVGLLSVLAYLLLGAFVGVLCASSRAVDLVLARLIDAQLALPPLLLLLAIQGLSGRGSVLAIAFVIALSEWPQAARLVRAQALRVAAERARLRGACARRGTDAHRLRARAAARARACVGARGLWLRAGGAVRERARISGLRDRAAGRVVG